MLFGGAGASRLSKMARRVLIAKNFDQSDCAVLQAFLKPQLIDFDGAHFAKASALGDGKCRG